MQLTARIRYEPDALLLDYAVTNGTGTPAYVLHLEFYQGSPSFLVQHVGPGVGLVYFGTPRMPSYMLMAWPPRPAGERVEPGVTLHGTARLGLPVVESGIAPPMFMAPGSVPEPVAESVTQLQVAMGWVPWKHRKPPPDATCGHADLYQRRSDEQYAWATIPLEAPIQVMRVPQTASTIDHVLPEGQRRAPPPV